MMRAPFRFHLFLVALGLLLLAAAAAEKQAKQLVELAAYYWDHSTWSPYATVPRFRTGSLSGPPSEGPYR